MDNIKATNIECCSVPEHAKLIEKLYTKIDYLETKNSDLLDQLAKNSSNSGKPPSSDGYEKPAPKSRRKKSGKKPGGQNGHDGESLQQVENPDKVVLHKVDVCERCGKNLKEEIAVSHHCRQEFELPPIKPVVTEHQAEEKLCPECLQINVAQFPENITQPVQYGRRVQAYSTYFNQQQFIAYGRLQDLFSDCFSLPISQGTLVTFNKRCAEKIDPSVQEIKAKIIASRVVNFDESGMRVKGKLHWLHVACTKELTYYELHEKRGQEAMNAIGILPNFTGTATHDHWVPYMNYTECDHSFCGSHYLRELDFVEERYHQVWAGKLATLLTGANTLVNQYKEQGKRKLEAEVLKKYCDDYSSILKAGLSEMPTCPQPEVKKRGRPKQHKAKNLWDRLVKYKQETLLFMHDFDVEFTNNLGERDIRMCKVKQKVSGTFRSIDGSKHFSKIRSYISTVRKQGHNVLESLTSAFGGKPFMPNSKST